MQLIIFKLLRNKLIIFSYKLKIMKIEIDNKDFSIRLYQDVAYLKVVGIQDQEAVDFFINQIDELIKLYSRNQFASVCDLTDLILTSPKLATKINDAIKKISNSLNYKHNEVVVKPRFYQITKAFVYMIYMKNTDVDTQIFREIDLALLWLNENGYQTDMLQEFLCSK